MQARDFCFWLQGAIELGNIEAPLTADQMNVVVKHLSLVLPSSAPANKLPPADALVFRLKMLHESNIDFGSGNTWVTVMAQLHAVFEHQLDKEVPYNPEHLHGEVLRC